jgi:hypothetical protein
MGSVINYGKNSPKNISVQTSNIYGGDMGRNLARQTSTSFTRGVQQIGQGGSAIDGQNNRIIIQSTTGSSDGIGSIPNSNNKYGFFTTDSSGKVIMEIVGGTQYTYNKNDNYNNSEINGFAPDDGRPGIWFAKVGYDCNTLLTT